VIPVPNVPAVPLDDDRFHAVFESAPVGIAIAGLGEGMRGMCLTANSMLAGLVALPVDELTGTPLQELLHPDDRERFMVELECLAGGVDAVRARVRLLARGGGEVPAIISATAAYDAARRWRCAIVQFVPR
jgi:PAS domain S-box-containing protein